MLRITRIILLLQLAHCFANEIEALTSTVLKRGSPSVSRMLVILSRLLYPKNIWIMLMLTRYGMKLNKVKYFRDTKLNCMEFNEDARETRIGVGYLQS